jgi:DNA-binding NtrC family response regulator
MATADATFDLALFRPQLGSRPLLFKPFAIPVQAAVPKTILVDEDRAFVETFAYLARKMRMPFQAIRSRAALDNKSVWNYDLVLMDEKTIGKENVFETAVKISRVRNDISVILIGDEEPTEKEMMAWAPFVKTFLCKNWDAEALINDALSVFASESRGPHMRRVKYFGGNYGTS